MILKRKSALRYHNIVFSITLICLSPFAWSQVIDPLALGDSLYTIGDYQAAITEYKRYLFFNERDEKKAEIHYRIGLCYRNIHDWDKAVNAFRKAIDYSTDDSLRTQYKITLGVVHISSGNYSSAEMVLLKLALFSKQPYIQTKASFFLAVNYIYRHKWKEARKYLEKALSADSLSYKQLYQLLDRAVRTKYKSPSKAKWLSTFVPGLGQSYAGKPLPALNAMAINGACGYLLYHSIVSHYGFIELVSYGSLFHRFWSGNRNRAADYARENKLKKDARLEEELLKAIDELLE